MSVYEAKVAVGRRVETSVIGKPEQPQDRSTVKAFPFALSSRAEGQ